MHNRNITNIVPSPIFPYLTTLYVMLVVSGSIVEGLLDITAMLQRM